MAQNVVHQSNVAVSLGMCQECITIDREEKMMCRITVVLILLALVVSATSVAWADGHKSVGQAQLYSWIIPGVGQMYVGDWGRGLAFMAANVLAWSEYDDSDSAGWLLATQAIRVYSGFDAGKCADKHNDRLPNRGLAVAPVFNARTETVGLALVTQF